MTGIHQTARKRSYATGALNTTAFSADDASFEFSTAGCTLNTDGTATLSGNIATSPASPRWWTDGSPPDTWISYSSTGGGTIVGGLIAGTRYQLNAGRTLANRSKTIAQTRVFTISFYDAASGGNLLGTKTFTASADPT